MPLSYEKKSSVLFILTGIFWLYADVFSMKMTWTSILYNMHGMIDGFLKK